MRSSTHRKSTPIKTRPWFILARHDNEGGEGGAQGGSGGEGGTQGGEGGAGGHAGSNGSGGTEKTFSQAEVDRLIGERLARQKAQFGDYEALKEKAAKHDAAEAANLSELEKAQRIAQQAAADRERLAEQLTQMQLQQAVKDAAVAEKAIDPDAVFSMLDKTALKVGDDGTVPGVAEAVKALLDQKTYLRPPAAQADDGRPGGNINQGQQGQQGGGALDYRTSSKEDIAAAAAALGVRI